MLLADKPKLAEGPGKDTTTRVCGVCHGVEVSISRRETRDGWNAIVVDMVERGAKGTDDEFGEVVDYLTAHYSPGTPGGKLNVNTATAAELASNLEISTEQAAAIVQYRKEKGNLQKFEDLSKVPGIDLAKLTSKKGLISF